MATAVTAPPRTLQGIAVPAESVRPQEFFARTRRHTFLERAFSYDGSSTQDVVELRKADILAGLDIEFVGTLTTTVGTGTVKSTGRYPYDLLKRVKFSANGQSNIINVSGAKLKVRDLMKRSDLTDRGVSNLLNTTATTQGTMGLASESWGVGTQVAAVADGAKDVHLAWHVPIAEDEVDLVGAIFLATSSSDLTLTLEYTPLSDLIPTTGNATATLVGTFYVTSRKFSIPIGSDGQIVVPDLSTFHSLIESRVAGGIQAGENELRVIGQGAGKSLLRVYGQLWNGAPSVPVPLTDTAYSQLAWRYGNNETPDVFRSGSYMRIDQERRYNSDFGGFWGFWCHDFANENVFRDVVDMGTTAELRLIVALASGYVLTSPAIEYVTETVFLAGQAA